MPTPERTPRALSIAVLVLALGASGCLIGKSEHTQYTGRYVSEETLEQIEPGDTQDEVASLLGQPSSRTRKETGTTVWRYSYSQATTKSGAVFLLFGSSTTIQVDGAVYVEFDAEHRVVKTWSER
jgi:outer membrane protein assembly factor BamE (lipoprotein component of BamABCDE complex)